MATTTPGNPRRDYMRDYMRRRRDRANPAALKRYAARVADALPHLHPKDAEAIRAILRAAT